MNRNKKAFITFGQSHRHQIGEQVFDKDTVCIIEANTEEEARKIAFKTFGSKWSFSYFEESWKEDQMKYYPKGYVTLVEQKPTLVMSNKEKLYTLLKIAKENGWENIPNFYEYFIEDQYSSLCIDEVTCMLNNAMYFDDFRETSLNDLIGNFESNKISFIHSLFNYAADKENIYNQFVAKLQIDILLPNAYDGCLLVQANWFSMPTSKRIDWFLDLFTPLIEHYEATK